MQKRQIALLTVASACLTANAGQIVNAYHTRLETEISMSAPCHVSSSGSGYVLATLAAFWQILNSETCGLSSDSYTPGPVYFDDFRDPFGTAISLGGGLGYNSAQSGAQLYVDAASVYQFTDVTSGISIATHVPCGEGYVDFLDLMGVGNAQSAGGFTAQLGSTPSPCPVTFTQSAEVLMESLGGASLRMIARDEPDPQQMYPVAIFVQTSFTCFGTSSILGVDVKQGAIGRLENLTQVKLGIFDDEAIEYGQQTGGPGYAGTVVSTFTAPNGTLSIEVHSLQRAIVLDGNIDFSSTAASCHADLAALHQANGAAIGEVSYVPEADLNLDGEIDGLDFAALQSVGCPADFNCDGVVDDADYLFFASAYNEMLTTDGDFNGDGVTDDGDYPIFDTAYNLLLCPIFPLFE